MGATCRVIGNRATAIEKKMSPLERTVRVAWWAVHKLQRYTAFAVGTSVVLADESFLTTLKLKHVHPRLAAYFIDLSMFRVKWIVDKSFFQFTQDWVSLDGLVEPLPPAKFKGMGEAV